MTPAERDIRAAISVIAVGAIILAVSLGFDLPGTSRVELGMAAVAAAILTPFILRWRRQSAEQARRLRSEAMSKPPDPRNRRG